MRLLLQAEPQGENVGDVILAALIRLPLLAPRLALELHVPVHLVSQPGAQNVAVIDPRRADKIVKPLAEFQRAD